MSATHSRDPAVLLASLVKRYGDKKAVDGLDLRVDQGEIFGLLGPNGAGKTTTLEIIAGLRAPTSGTVRVAGLDPTAERQELVRVLAVQPQQAQLFPLLTAEETLTLWRTFYERPGDVAELLAAVSLTESARTQVRNLSGGQERRLLIACALIGRPRAVVLDEPSTGLDPNARAELWEVLLRFRDEGGTVMLSTHSMDEAQSLCDRVAIIDHGRLLAEGSPAELIARHAPHHLVTFSRDAGHARDLLASRPDVLAIDVRGTKVHVSTSDPTAVSALLRGIDPPVRDVVVRASGLDEVYRELTGRVFTEVKV
ncbi:ABC transporter ATP-binding protein [Nonomuraea sp. NPDC050786]|uniref:ABC transporter ATP-binding protein n=1 Tax=Nonomuraea sp. NPDC050786 TaxID=3154840 RepID=UPI0033DE0574